MSRQRGGPEDYTDHLNGRDINQTDNESQQRHLHNYDQSNESRVGRPPREPDSDHSRRQTSTPYRRSRSCISPRNAEGNPSSPKRGTVSKRPPRDMTTAVPALSLYHVSRPETRASWVFNLSKFTHNHDKRSEPQGPPPDKVTSSVDETRPNLGGLVWVNATLGGHCCLQKGSKTKVVTEVSVSVLDGWLNGQSGLWWLGALKEGHRTMWDSHIVMSWAMVFIPSFPEMAARNNMDVWKDKCLRGSLRVARPGELARKIVDIVADDQDADPESVVHTHLCILLAEGDDLELKRPRMASMTPRTSEENAVPFVANGVSKHARLSGSKSTGHLDTSLLQDFNSEGGVLVTRGAGAMTLEEALDRVERYRDRVRTLKDDRQAKKAMISRLKDELRHKEVMYTEENERLRLERNELRTKTKVLRMDLESMQRDSSRVSPEELEQLHYDVERLRRERDDARTEAMRWLEQEQAKQEAASAAAAAEAAANAAAAAAATATAAISSSGEESSNELSKGSGKRSHDKTTNGYANGTTNHLSPDGGAGRRSRGSSFDFGSGHGVGITKTDGEKDRDKAAIAKLRAKVDRLRLERDEAEEQAARWLNEQQQKLKAEIGVADGINGEISRSNGTQKSAGGPVVASLKAESSRLRKELEDTRAEAQRWREKAASTTSNGRTGPGFANLTLPETARTNDPEEANAQAKKTLEQLLGKALHLLSPKAAAEAAAEIATKAAANAEAAASGEHMNGQGGAGGEDTAESNPLTAATPMATPLEA